MDSKSITHTNKRERIEMLDFLRGIAVLGMIFFHVIYDEAYIFGNQTAQNLHYRIENFGFIFSTTFILISGICTRLSRNTAENGARLLMIAYAFTLITAIVMPEQIIVFGILHMFAFSMLCFAAVRRFLDKIPPVAGVLLSLLLYVVFFSVGEGYIGIKGIFSYDIPPSLLQTDVLYPIGLHSTMFFSSDYWPFFPWIFLFLTGTFIGVWAKNGQFPKFTYNINVKPINFIGRHSLVVYIVHQPVIYALLWVINKI